MGLVKTFKLGAIPIIEGVAARGRDQYAIAIKKSNGNILLDKGKMNFVSRLPLIFIRGIISFWEHCALAYKTLLYSGDYFDNEERNAGDTEILSKEEFLNKQDRIKAENSQSWLIFSLVLILSLVAIVVFFLAPVYISSAFFDNVRDENWIGFNAVECISRIVLLFLYFIIIKVSGGPLKKLRQYNAASNRAINCFEAGKDVSYDNVKSASKFHPRSFTYMLFLTVIISNVALIFIKMDSLLIAFLIRLLVLILSINIAYEISRLFGMFNGKFSRAMAMVFGMWVEIFTLSEPEAMQTYVAITAVRNTMIEG